MNTAINHSLGRGAPGIVSTPVGPHPRLEFSFVVPGPPVPKARARVVNGHAYTPARTQAYERHVATLALAACSSASLPSRFHKWPPDALYGVEITVYRSAARGDWDNFAKSICDGCNGIVWGDDRQIREARVRLARTVPKGKERVEVHVWTMPEAT